MLALLLRAKHNVAESYFSGTCNHSAKTAGLTTLKIQSKPHDTENDVDYSNIDSSYSQTGTILCHEHAKVQMTKSLPKNSSVYPPNDFKVVCRGGPLSSDSYLRERILIATTRLARQGCTSAWLDSEADAVGPRCSRSESAGACGVTEVDPGLLC